jgi:two-component system, OmpR family, sensor kinase
MHRLDLRHVLEQAVEDGRMLALDRGLELAARQPEEPVHVRGDGQRLYQTLLIAIDNAVKYASPQTTVEVELGTADGQSSIVVRNCGVGVPAEDLPYVFDRFYRGRHNASPSGGSGLGLSIAKWIVEKHAGTIALVSKPGGVTELEIHLPVARADNDPGTSRALAPPAV